MTADYTISGKRLTGFADQARRLGKVSGKLSPQQIEEILRGVQIGESALFQSFFSDMVDGQIGSRLKSRAFSGSVSDIYTDQMIAVAAFAPGGMLELSSAFSKYSYNGVILPPIPKEVLEGYPFAWIRNNGDTGYYDLLMATGPWYRVNDYTLNHNDSNSIAWYRIEKASAEAAEAWEFYQDYQSIGWGIDANRVCMWSNKDIHSGSVNGSEIYFEGSEPVPAE